MAHSNRKKQRDFFNKLKSYPSAEETIIYLYEDRIHPDDLPRKKAYLYLVKVFKYKSLELQQTLYWLAKIK